MSVTVASSDWQSAPAAAATPLVTIGDIHGAHHQLAALRAHLDAETDKARRVYLGDLIDPHSSRSATTDCSAVLDQVAADLACGAEILAGNHESMFLIAVENARRLRIGERIICSDLSSDSGSWCRNGAALTARSFGIADETLPDEALGEQIWARMTPGQRRVVDALQIAIDHGPYLLVHAGVDPDAEAGWRDPSAKLRPPVPYGRERHPMWIRYADFEDDAPRGRVLIHGHTPRRTPFLGRRRICIDTGAKIGGPLTAIEIVGDRMRLHQAWATDMPPAAWDAIWRRG